MLRPNRQFICQHLDIFDLYTMIALSLSFEKIVCRGIGDSMPSQSTLDGLSLLFDTQVIFQLT